MPGVQGSLREVNAAQVAAKGNLVGTLGNST